MFLMEIRDAVDWDRIQNAFVCSGPCWFLFNGVPRCRRSKAFAFWSGYLSCHRCCCLVITRRRRQQVDGSKASSVMYGSGETRKGILGKDRDREIHKWIADSEFQNNLGYVSRRARCHWTVEVKSNVSIFSHFRLKWAARVTPSPHPLLWKCEKRCFQDSLAIYLDIGAFEGKEGLSGASMTIFKCKFRFCTNLGIMEW